MNLNNLHSLFYKQSKDGKPGLWANIHAKRKRGEPAAKPGDEDYPDSKNWKKVTSESEKKASPAWQRAEGKNPEGGLNEKGRASLKAEGKDIKRPQPEGGPRKDSFCARMKGMKSKLTSEETANDPDSRINKSLRKWKCGSADISKESDSMSNSSNVVFGGKYSGMNKHAEEAYRPKYKLAPEKKDPSAKDTADELISSGTAAKYLDLLGTAYTQSRAGKATSVLKALDKNPSFPVRNPLTSLLLHYGGGGLLGAAGGAVLANMLGKGPGTQEAFTRAGGLLGMATGGLTSQIRMAREIQRARREYEDAINKGTELNISAANPNLSRLGALLPYGGFHRSGSVDALEHMTGRPIASSKAKELGRAAQFIPYVGMPATIASGAAEGYDAAVRNKKLMSDLSKQGSTLSFKSFSGIDASFPEGIEMSEVKSASVALAEKLGTQAGLAIKQAGLQDYINAAKGYVGSAVGGLGSAAGNLGSQALSMYKGLDPTAQAALLGGGAGAAVGGIGNALFGKRKKGVGILGRLLRGSLAGGAIGGLGGAGINEAALRLGMRNSGADRNSQIYMSGNEAPRLPSQLANSYLGIQ